MPRGDRWRMEKPCADCPFNSKGPGLRLRRSLRPGRFAEITEGLRRGGHFECHKTTRSTGDGSRLVCAGSIAWQAKRGIVSQYQRVCESLAYFSKRRKKTTTSTTE